MAVNHRIRLQQIIREAEGYLELSILFSDDFDTSVARERLTPRAIDILKRVSDAGSLRGHALYLRGEALRSLDRYQEALEPLQTASEIDPENIHIWLALGWCYKRIGRLDLAIESLERALESDECKAIVYYNLACYWSLAHNKNRALEYLTQALAVNPDYRDMVSREQDFDFLRADPDFLALTSLIA